MNAKDFELIKIRRNMNRYVLNKLKNDEDVSEPILRYVCNDTTPIVVDELEVSYDLNDLASNNEDFAFLNNDSFTTNRVKGARWFRYFHKKRELKGKNKRNLPDILKEI